MADIDEMTLDEIAAALAKRCEHFIMCAVAPMSGQSLGTRRWMSGDSLIIIGILDVVHQELVCAALNNVRRKE